MCLLSFFPHLRSNRNVTNLDRKSEHGRFPYFLSQIEMVDIYQIGPMYQDLTLWNKYVLVEDLQGLFIYVELKGPLIFQKVSVCS